MSSPPPDSADIGWGARKGYGGYEQNAPVESKTQFFAHPSAFLRFLFLNLVARAVLGRFGGGGGVIAACFGGNCIVLWGYPQRTLKSTRRGLQGVRRVFCCRVKFC